MNNRYSPPGHAKPLDLRGPFLKLQWAIKHIDKLNSERVSFLGRNQYFGIPKFNPETNTTQFILENVPAIPDTMRLRLGDCAHNLRTSLDHLACETVRSVGNDTKRVYFPISETFEKYEAESGGKTPGMPEEAKKVIDSFHPYGGKNPLLWGLHELDRIDKHRLPLTTTTKIGSWSMTLTREVRGYNFPFHSALKAGDVIGEVEGQCKPDEKMGITTDIVFGEPEIFCGEAIFPTLKVIAAQVEDILLSFGPNPL